MLREASARFGESQELGAPARIAIVRDSETALTLLRPAREVKKHLDAINNEQKTAVAAQIRRGLSPEHASGRHGYGGGAKDVCECRTRTGTKGRPSKRGQKSGAAKKQNVNRNSAKPLSWKRGAEERRITRTRARKAEDPPGNDPLSACEKTFPARRRERRKKREGAGQGSRGAKQQRQRRHTRG